MIDETISGKNMLLACFCIYVKKAGRYHEHVWLFSPSAHSSWASKQRQADSSNVSKVCFDNTIPLLTSSCRYRQRQTMPGRFGHFGESMSCQTIVAIGPSSYVR